MPYRFSGQPRQWKRRPQDSIPSRSPHMPTFNPLFEREWRGRFRRPSSHLQLGLLVSLMTALVCFGVWHVGFAPAMTVMEWRSNGRALLNGYRWLGALVFWGGALLMGVTTVSDEKAGATWEHLLLCPVGGRGLTVGKIASGAAWLLIMQVVLFPPLLVAGRCFGVTPPEIAGVMVSHLLLTIQGTTLGLWGALRGRTLTDSVAQSLSAPGRFLLLFAMAAFLSSGVVIFLGQLVRALFLLPFPGSVALLKVLWLPVSAVLLFTAQTLTSLMAGITGVGVPLLSFPVVGDFLRPLPLLTGQILGIALFLKWSAWSIDYPTRDFWGVIQERRPSHRSNDHLRVLYRVWR